MADNEVKIYVLTDVDASEVESLEDYIANIQNQSVTIPVDDSEITELEDKIAELQTSIEEDTEWGLDTSESEAELEELQAKLEELQSSAEEIPVTFSVDDSGIDEANDKLNETTSTADSLSTAVVGIGATAGLEQMISTADNINTSWNRLQLTFGNTGVSMDELKSKASALSSETGRSGGTIRSYFNQMGIAGVTNTNLLSSSFAALSGKAYQTGNSIESMETRLQRMVMTGNASGMALQKLGIDAQDLATAMGVSVDQVSEAFANLTPEERLQAISQAMGDGAQANEMYKNSYEGLKAQADAAMAGLMGAVGQAILPVVVPALQAATQGVKMLTDGFKALPEPIQGVIGGIGGFLAVATTIIGVLGVVGNVVKSVKSGLEALNLVTKLSAAYTRIAAAAQAVYNAIMLMNPVYLVVVALIALVAILIWAYYNVDWFREMVDNAWASLVQFGQYIYSVITGAIQWLGDLFMQAATTISESVMWWWNAIVNFLTQLATFPGRVWSYLSQTIQHAISFASSFIQSMWNAGVNSVKNFISNISQIPAKLGAELSSALDKVNEWAATLPAKFWEAGVNAVKNFLSALGIASPGTMQRMLVWEVSEMGRRVPIEGEKLTSNLEQLGSDAVDSFGNPSLGIGFDDVDDNFANGSIDKMLNVAGQNRGDIVVNVYGDIDNDDRVRKLVDAVRRELNWNNVTAGRTI